ncbi:tetratricopeptide repeat protein [delta proteobacterium NaphS2]|nr:tetratricopeptide repeat protein [delta proteobacterium NaphS2]
MPKGNCEFRATGGQYFSTVMFHLGLFSLFSLGIYLPWALVRLFRLKASHTAIQGKETEFSGSGGELFGLLLVSSLLTIVTLGLYGPWAFCRIFRWKADHTLVGGVPSRFSGTGGGLFVFYLFQLILLPMLTFGFYYPVGMYRFHAWKEEHTLYGGKPASFGAGLGAYIKICLITWILNSLTLGLFTPWALCMLYRWQMGGVAVGDPELTDHFPPVHTSWRAVLITFLMGLLLVASMGFLILEEIKFHMQAFSKGSVQKTAVLKSKIVMSKPGTSPGEIVQRAEKPKPAGKESALKPSKPKKIQPEKPQAVNEDFENQLRKIDLLIQDNPKNSIAYYNRACLYASKENFDQALKDFTQAINIDSENAEAYYNRGVVYARKKQYNMAIQDFQTVIGLNPAFEDAYCNRGNVYYALKKYHLAVQDYHKALEIDPEDGDVYFNRGLSYLALGQENRAFADFKKAVALGQKKAEAYLER